MKAKVTYLSPAGLHTNPAFSQVAVIESSARANPVGGQNAVSAAGEIVAKGDIAVQAEQVLKNLEVALQSAGADLESVIKRSVYVVHGQPLGPGFEVFKRVSGRHPNPPLITVLFLSGLADSDFLMELEAVAAIPGE